MENRIEINGVWYVRENANIDHIEPEEMDLTFSEECCYENNKYCFVIFLSSIAPPVRVSKYP